MEDRKFNYENLLYILLISGFLLMTLRYTVAFRMMIVPFTVGTTLVFSAYVLASALRQRQRERAFRNSTAGIIQRRLRECEAQIEHHAAEIADIEEHMVELEQKLRVHKDLPLHLQDETEQLVESFRSQLKLRLSKLAFFETCRMKLEQLLQQHELSQTLQAKRAKLKRLQEDNYEDMAKMEEMRAHLEYDTLYLDTIENLSKKLQHSNTYTDVERLRAELDEMTKSLSSKN